MKYLTPMNAMLWLLPVAALLIWLVIYIYTLPFDPFDARLSPVEVHASKLPERGSVAWKMDFEGFSFEEATARLAREGAQH